MRQAEVIISVHEYTALKNCEKLIKSKAVAYSEDLGTIHVFKESQLTTALIENIEHLKELNRNKSAEIYELRDTADKNSKGIKPAYWVVFILTALLCFVSGLALAENVDAKNITEVFFTESSDAPSPNEVKAKDHNMYWRNDTLWDNEDYTGFLKVYPKSLLNKLRSE